MATDLVWIASPTAKRFHARPEGNRRTVCGEFTGEIVGGALARGALRPRADMAAVGKTECNSCYGHAERRQPIIEGRPNG